MASNLTRNTKNTLRDNERRPLKGLGQNFLIDKAILSKIIKTADIKPTDIVIEIGPGLGVLTKELAKRAKKVIAIEKDAKLAEMLKENLKEYNNLEIINSDILKLNPIPYTLHPTPYKLVANLPYYITSPIIREFLEAKNKPELMVLMVQKEVSQRICAKPPQMSILSVSVQIYAQPKIITYVSKNSFWPKPKIDSAIIEIKPKDKPNINADLFFEIIKAGFSQPRKQIGNNFAKNLSSLSKEQIENWLALNKIKSSQRAESLSIDDWVNLLKSFKCG